MFPTAWKRAIVKPLLKKKGLSLEMKNYRPISNLTFLSKILEKSALEQIMSHIENYNLLPAYQSAYRQNHGVETALLKMYNDLLHAVDNKQVSIVVMIDLSAAFDTVDLPIVLNILQQDFKVSGTPLKWIKSYLSQRTMCVSINGTFTEPGDLLFGVP